MQKESRHEAKSIEQVGFALEVVSWCCTELS